MRRIEALHYLLSIGYFALFFTGIYNEALKPGVSCLVVMFPVVHYFEGIRLIQFPFITGVIIHLGVVFFQGPWPFYVSVLSCALLCLSIIISIHLGSSDLSCVTLNDAPYLVGHRDIRTITLGQEISVYYPVDRTSENERLLRNNESSWLRREEKTLLGMARASVKYGREDHPSVRWFRWLRRVKMGTIERVGEVAKAFVPASDRLSE